MSLKSNTWTLRGGDVFTPAPFALMGIVNITPDSFSDGGQYHLPAKALAHAKQLWQEGAVFLDLGAESSRPGAQPLSSEEELARLMPVLSPLLQSCTQLFTKEDSPPTTPSTPPYISVDTYHAQTAVAVLEAGAHVINDISACLFEPELLDVVAQYKPGYVLMHSTARPQIMQDYLSSGNIMDTLQRFFEAQLQRITQAGLPEQHILLDPGIGFGKSVEQNREILCNIQQLESFGRPVLGAISMKSFLHKYLHFDASDTQARALATHNATALLGTQGICYHRVHHVIQSVRALNLAYGMVKI